MSVSKQVSKKAVKVSENNKIVTWQALVNAHSICRLRVNVIQSLVKVKRSRAVRRRVCSFHKQFLTVISQIPEPYHHSHITNAMKHLHFIISTMIAMYATRDHIGH